MTLSDRILVIAGPTAVGKSSLALAVAERVGGEILSADSRQVYRGLDIGTAKPPPQERKRVRHHMLDRLDPGGRGSAGWFVDEAAGSITDVRARGNPVVVVGGSTLYVHALVEGLADLPPVSPSLEAALMEEVRQGGAHRLYQELAEADPQAANTLDASKTHRLVRYVGVLRESGRRPSELWAERSRPPVPAHLVILDRPREELYARIDARVETMLTDGLVEETRRALARTPAARTTLATTIGYRELLPVLDGERGLEEAVRLIQRNSRRYAKRQLTWYRRYSTAVRLDARTATADDVLEAVAPWPVAEEQE